MNATLLKQSFDMIVPQKEAFARSFYQHLFAHYPHVQQLFAQTDMKKQESSLIATLATVVAGVERGEDLTPALQLLGKKHQGYGVRPNHYPLVGEILLETLQEYLGSRFTAEVRETWSEAFGFISTQMMLSGAEEQVS